MNSLEGKVILVTGAASGIGQATAAAVREAGGIVAAADISAIANLGPNDMSLKLDVSDAERHAIFGTHVDVVVADQADAGADIASSYTLKVSSLAEPDTSERPARNDVPASATPLGAFACGGATQKVEDATKVKLAPVSEETSVTDVLNKVTSGQADAGVVYVTDAAGAGDKVATVAFPESAGAVNTYPIAVLKQSKSADLAHKFVDLVTGEFGQKVLAKAGFAKP